MKTWGALVGAGAIVLALGVASPAVAVESTAVHQGVPISNFTDLGKTVFLLGMTMDFN